jgi:hypothetical protein
MLSKVSPFPAFTGHFIFIVEAHFGKR